MLSEQNNCGGYYEEFDYIYISTAPLCGVQ